MAGKLLPHFNIIQLIFRRSVIKELKSSGTCWVSTNCPFFICSPKKCSAFTLLPHKAFFLQNTCSIVLIRMLAGFSLKIFLNPLVWNHYLKKIETITGEITDMTADTVVVGAQTHIQADIIVNCVGFERNAPLTEALSGYSEMYSNNYIDKDFMYLADAYIDADAFNSLFGSSVLEMVKFYMEVYVTYFNNPEFDTMMQIDQIEKLPIEQRKWSHYIKGAMALIQNDRKIHDIAWQQVGQRTDNFLQAHDLSTYIEQNKREWLDMHEMLTGRPMKEEECLPYVFEKMLN